VKNATTKTTLARKPRQRDFNKLTPCCTHCDAFNGWTLNAVVALLGAVIYLAKSADIPKADQRKIRRDMNNSIPVPWGYSIASKKAAEAAEVGRR
jgi:hypothetical protein